MSFKNNKELARQAGKLSSRKGQSNKMSVETREAFKVLVESNLTRLQDDINQLEPKDRLKVIMELATFVLPKLNAIDITSGGEQLERFVTINIEDYE
ncbi:hypothetical protein APS56_04095 [Pseudalgibacter alginicilyticus]|uniref:Uncharacterized protein n=1 Tax=Pseudalgibacter alginicilyticus TaxID=1736674 RepID=A0A0P0D914_9FLAO|nr:hypothetical protein [Pseudalgibacter alginicilyticus]ALJ04369.1 hypothetical protein APS56_04095 [Pseudalgibacter alginicilyticus]